MTDDGRAARRQEIAEAAYAVLQEKGYAGASMLAVAKRARASNETLYNWYGDKRGLFKDLVSANADAARAVLEDSLAADAAFEDTLRTFGATLLGAILSDRAIALNKAAAADPTGELGAALAATGRETVLPLLTAFFERRRPAGAFATVDDMVETYLGLLVGDRQIRRAIGALPAPTEAECRAISENALAKLMRLLDAPAARPFI